MTRHPRPAARGPSRCKTGARLVALTTIALLGLLPASALGYGYSRDEDPLLIALRGAVEAARADDVSGALEQVDAVQWQLDELRDDVGIDFEDALRAAHAPGASSTQVIHAWSNLVYLALPQKFHWNLDEELADYHSASARLEAAETYYDMVFAGNVRRHDRARRARNPDARSRHDDIVAQFARARDALGSPGLLGQGARAPDLDAFRAAVVRIAGHLNTVFSDFVRPGRD